MNAEQTSFKVPLSFEAHHQAEKRRQGISNTENAKKIYLNTLAVYAVNYYLDCMGFETNFSDADRSNPWMLSLIDVADLEVKNIGTIECRPVLPDAEYLEIPTEVSADRIGYVAVQLSESLKSATILGFTKAAAKISLSYLQSVDDLLDYLTQKEQAVKVSLHQWIKGVITEGWQTIDELLNPQQIEWMGCRSFSITRGKKIDLGLELNGESVALIVTLAPENQSAIKNQDEVNILIQVSLPKEEYIPGKNVYIPEKLKVAVIDDKGDEVLYTTSRQNDNWIEVEFSAQFGEKFSVDVILGESKVTQQFVV
ncbi:DUF1822 family protein [Iningainema tapete]|uniref:DUF1822 family protein n=1 Tax=Iningainema tapete BLCC-T55 TaxID=2748662 RepID=A0A8J6XLH8_9CYAN|nr:DUF1822 family protein [Iningainema tapete]MBD2774986.1 DUF1822 family protein [Iningainema tapete BLCC-T55]